MPERRNGQLGEDGETELDARPGSVRHGGPLSGVRVLELGQLIAGTYGGMLLADFGADVIKVEAPTGDIGRNPQVSPIGANDALFLTMNRGKRSVVLDLKSELGVSVFYRLVANSDVVVANYRAGVLERLGLDYNRLRSINPAVILCDISGFGGRVAGVQPPSFDLTHQALSGLMSITGEPGGPPARLGVPIADLGTALFAMLGVLSAIVGRASSGEGTEVDVAMLQVATFLLGYDATTYLNTGAVPRALGTAHASSVPWQAFETADGWLVVAVREEKFWIAYCHAIGMPQLTTDERFTSNAARVRNRDVLVPLLAERMRAETTDSWLRIFSTDVPVAPVLSVAQALARADGAAGEIVEIPCPPADPVRMLRNPVRFRSATAHYGPAPMLGEHTTEVLAQVAGFSAAEIADLVSRGVAMRGDEAEQ